MPRRSPFVIRLTEQERSELEARCKEYTSPYRDVVRAKIGTCWLARELVTLS